MFGKEIIETLKETIAKQDKEIEFLRTQVVTLQDRVMAFSGQAFQSYLHRDFAAMKVPAPVYVDPLGALQSMAAETEEEKQEKKMALDQITQILGAGVA